MIFPSAFYLYAVVALTIQPASLLVFYVSILHFPPHPRPSGGYVCHILDSVCQAERYSHMKNEREHLAGVLKRSGVTLASFNHIFFFRIE